MDKTTNVSFRINSKLKNDADRLFAELGLNMTSAINMFIRQSVRDKEIPFKPSAYDWSAHENSSHIPNAETLDAMREIEDMISGKAQENAMNDKEFDNFINKMVK